MGLRRSPVAMAARREVLHFLRRLVLLLALLTVLVLRRSGAALGASRTSRYWRGLALGARHRRHDRLDPRPERLGGQLTKIALIVFGVGTMFFVLVTLTEFFVAGDLSGLLEARRMQNKIAQLKDHYLICGFGRVGQPDRARPQDGAGVPFVVIDDNPEVRADARARWRCCSIEGQRFRRRGAERGRASSAPAR